MMATGGYSDLTLPQLPVDEVLGELLAVLEAGSRAVLVAPPGAGKTTRVPLALLGAPWLSDRRIIVLEPRRLAARAAAGQMARLLGEEVGKTVGYRVRMDTKTSPETRIEVVTEGVFTRMILDDPELTGIGAVLFDEFHERSLEGDLGLALATDAQTALRNDLRILPMSATIDGARVAALLDDAPVIESEGRLFPVEIRYEPMEAGLPVEERSCRAIRSVLSERKRSILCFLPGQAEIRRTAERLGALPDNTELYQLYSAMDLRDQDLAIRPTESGRRKIVLATPIAETSLTIEGVDTVIDGGLTRVPRFEPAVGITRLETVRASRASIAQRAGRAGRLGPGIAIRLWAEGQTRALSEFDPPEIVNADLSGLLLDLADWGATDPNDLLWLDPPPQAALAEAKTLLEALGALDANGRITARGRAIRRLALPPRLAAMVLEAGQHGQSMMTAELAILSSEQGLGGTDPDLAVRLQNFRRDGSQRARRARAMASRIASGCSEDGKNAGWSAGAILSIAWPERIGKRVKTVRGPAGEEAVFALASGRRASLRDSEALKRSDFIVATDVQGKAAKATIRAAAAITLDEIRQLHSGRIEKLRELSLEKRDGRPAARIRESLGKLVLVEQPAALEPDDDIPGLLIGYVREEGLASLPFGKHSINLLTRMRFARHFRPEIFPDADDHALLASLDWWLTSFLQGKTALAELNDRVLCEALTYYLGYGRVSELDRLAPSAFETPAGSRISIVYMEDKVTLPVRVQELYGLTEQPVVMDGEIPIMLELLSPAMRPVQTTADIAGFWRGNWQDVRKEMRGRYPKHFWPEDPANASPTTRTKAAMARTGGDSR